MNAPQSEDERLANNAKALGNVCVHSYEGYPGISLRQLFAGMIAQGLAPAYAQGGDFMEEHVAEGAVKVADALLKELAK